MDLQMHRNATTTISCSCRTSPDFAAPTRLSALLPVFIHHPCNGCRNPRTFPLPDSGLNPITANTLAAFHAFEVSVRSLHPSNRSFFILDRAKHLTTRFFSIRLCFSTTKGGSQAPRRPPHRPSTQLPGHPAAEHENGCCQRPRPSLSILRIFVQLISLLGSIVLFNFLASGTMKPARSLGHLAAVFLCTSPLASAWPSWLLPELDALVVRADKTTSSNPPAETTTSAASQNADTTFNLNTAGISSSGSPAPTATGNSTKTTSKSRQTTQFNPQDPVGSVVMLTPATTALTQLYKIGDFVTWGWNYTNLQATPTGIDVYASCSSATRTYTLTQNMTFETLGSFTWDTGAYQSTAVANPLVVQQYTLLIFDVDGGPTAAAAAGYLGTFDTFQFGMYTPQPYTALNDGWTCATCSLAASDTDRRALGLALAMCVVTVLSFTWFVTGLGVAL